MENLLYQKYINEDKTLYIKYQGKDLVYYFLDSTFRKFEICKTKISLSSYPLLKEYLEMGYIIHLGFNKNKLFFGELISIEEPKKEYYQGVNIQEILTMLDQNLITKNR